MKNELQGKVLKLSPQTNRPRRITHTHKHAARALVNLHLVPISKE